MKIIFKHSEFKNDFRKFKFYSKKSFRQISKETKVNYKCLFMIERGKTKQTSIENFLKICFLMEKDPNNYIIFIPNEKV